MVEQFFKQLEPKESDARLPCDLNKCFVIAGIRSPNTGLHRILKVFDVPVFVPLVPYSRKLAPFMNHSLISKGGVRACLGSQHRLAQL